MAATKKVTELDPRVMAIIDEEFADFEKFIPSIQDIKVYQRKRKEYWEKIAARLKEEVISDGRANDSTADTGTN